MDLATDTGDKIVHRLLITTMHERTRPKKDKPNNNSLEHDATATISARARSRIPLARSRQMIPPCYLIMREANLSGTL